MNNIVRIVGLLLVAAIGCGGQVAGPSTTPATAALQGFGIASYELTDDTASPGGPILIGLLDAKRQLIGQFESSPANKSGTLRWQGRTLHIANASVDVEERSGKVVTFDLNDKTAAANFHAGYQNEENLVSALVELTPSIKDTVQADSCWGQGKYCGDCCGFYNHCDLCCGGRFYYRLGIERCCGYQPWPPWASCH